MSILIAYFSKDGGNSVDGVTQNLEKGNTEVVAEKIARLTGGELYPLIPVEPYSNNYMVTTARAKKELEEGAFPEIANLKKSIAEYDVIYLGFPNWYRSYPRIIATFLKSYDFSGKTIKPFCTNEEGAFGIGELELRATLKDSIVKEGFAVKGSEVDDCDLALSAWVNK